MRDRQRGGGQGLESEGARVHIKFIEKLYVFEKVENNVH